MEEHESQVREAWERKEEEEKTEIVFPKFFLTLYKVLALCLNSAITNQNIQNKFNIT